MKSIHFKSLTEDDFNHPALEEDHPLKRHVLYRMTRDNYQRLNITPPIPYPIRSKNLPA